MCPRCASFQCSIIPSVFCAVCPSVCAPLSVSDSRLLVCVSVTYRCLSVSVRMSVFAFVPVCLCVSTLVRASPLVQISEHFTMLALFRMCVESECLDACNRPPPHASSRHDRDAERPKQTRMKEERTRHRRTRDNKIETKTVTDRIDSADEKL